MILLKLEQDVERRDEIFNAVATSKLVIVGTLLFFFQPSNCCVLIATITAKERLLKSLVFSIATYGSVCGC